jgi:D-glycero-D-manno-heptose 1,7-bisphosphate phosphatase
MHAGHHGGSRAGRGAAVVVSAVRAVFLDRDGTIIEDVGYLDRVGRISVFPWSIDAIRALNRAGLPVIVVTNQAGVARGFFGEEKVREIHLALDERMRDGGARIDAYYYCPHHPEGTVEAYRQRCDCRKPGRALVDRAALDLGVDPTRSFVVGDRWHDVALANSVGAAGVLVRTGYGAAEAERPVKGPVPAAIVDNLVEAASWILRAL